jgi:hypothetical protein
VSGLYSIPEQRWTGTRSTERPRDVYADVNQPSPLDDTSATLPCGPGRGRESLL